jgi:dTDP-4-amino-4,6-dideoxygalactose transaminase
MQTRTTREHTHTTHARERTTEKMSFASSHLYGRFLKYKVKQRCSFSDDVKTTLRRKVVNNVAAAATTTTTDRDDGIIGIRRQRRRGGLIATKYALAENGVLDGSDELSVNTNPNQWTSIESSTVQKAGFVKPEKFTKDFSKPMSIPTEGIEAAIRVMESGRVFRYCATSAETSEVAQAEDQFAEMVGQKYAIGVNSCSSAIFIAMLATGVEQGDKVLTNGFTFTALPSCILRIGCEPVLVECTENFTMDLDDLDKKAGESGAKVLLMSHMRGKVCDMDKVVAICEKHGMKLIEDCAHGCGVRYKGRQLGYHGVVTAYSTQSDKVINSGEGGFITTDDDDIAARCLYMSGCYERRYSKHARMPPQELCEKYMLTMPNLSSRMNEVTAAMMRPLITNLYSERLPRYMERWLLITSVIDLMAGEYVSVPTSGPNVEDVGDHLNFTLKNVTEEENAKFREITTELGVNLGWFTSSVNARFHKNWEKYGTPKYDLPQTDKVLEYSYDMKMPPDFETEDFQHIGHVISYAVNKAKGLCA